MKYEKLVESSYKGEKFEALKSGKVLLELKRRFLEQPSRNRMIELIDCLTDSLLYVPMNAILSDKNTEALKNCKVGDEVKLVEDLRMTPDYLQNPEGNLYIPVFSQKEQVDKNYCKQFSGIYIHISEVIELYKHPREKLAGIILDAHTKPIIFDDNLIDIIEKIMELKEEEKRDTI